MSAFLAIESRHPCGFDLLGVKPLLGRGFVWAEDESTTAAPVAIISYDLWQTRVLGDPGVYDVNADGVTNDFCPTAYRFKSVDDAGNPTFEEIGPCEKINCGRGSALSQFNLRVGKTIADPQLDAR